MNQICRCCNAAYILCMVLYASLAHGAALSTGFSEVLLSNLQTGKSYSTAKIAHMPLAVINTGRETVNLKIDVLIPKSSDLKEGYEAVPDKSWIKIKKEYFRGLPPGDKAVTDVLVQIPDDTKYAGRSYQVYLRSHTVGERGLAIAVGLRSRLLFTVAEETEKDKGGFLGRLFRWPWFNKRAE